MERFRTWNPPTRPRVLLVEWQADTRALCAIALSASGFDVVAVSNGVEAYSRALEIHPDIIVIDLPLLNDEDGWQFLQDVKRTARTRDIPVVAVSDDVRWSPRARADRDGFAAFFPKHCLPDELAARLRQLLDGKVHSHVER